MPLVDSESGMSGGMIAFFVVVGLAFLALVVLGGCYHAKGKVGYLTRKLLANVTNGFQNKNAQAAKPAAGRKKKFTASADTTAQPAAHATKQAPNNRKRQLTARNVRRQATKLTGASINSGAVTLRGGTSLSAEQILDVAAQTSGPSSARNQQISFQGSYLPYGRNISVSQGVAMQQQAHAALQASGSSALPISVDPELDFVATHGAATLRV